MTANFVIVKGKFNIGTESSPYTGKITFNLTSDNYEYKVESGSVGIKAFAVVMFKLSSFTSLILSSNLYH